MWDSFMELRHYGRIRDPYSSEAIAIFLESESVVFLGTVFFSLLGAVMLCRQIKKIKLEGASSVSFHWKVSFLAMYTAFLPYGLERASLALLIQFVCRVPLYLLLVLNVYQDRGKLSLEEKVVAVIAAGLAVYSFAEPVIIATCLRWVCIPIAAMQTVKLIRLRDVKGTEPLLFVSYLGTAIFWLLYGIKYSDGYIISWAVPYSIVYASGVLAYMWVRYRQSSPSPT